MNRNRFWLTDEKFKKIANHLPTGTRGKPRVDDRRVISGIIHVLKSGGRWVDPQPLWTAQDPLQPLRSLGCEGHLGRSVSCACKRRRPTRSGVNRLVCREGPPLRLGRKRGEHQQAIGRSRGGRSTKIHALADRLCRPIAFLLTGGNVADCEAAKQRLEHLPASRVLHGDKGYDTDAFRRRRPTARCPTSRRR